MVIPQQHRNCSFSIIYPVAIDISEFSLGQFSHFPKVSFMCNNHIFPSISPPEMQLLNAARNEQKPFKTPLKPENIL